MASTKLFNFRCPSELLQAVEGYAATKGLTKTEAAAALLRLGLQSQSVEVPAPTPQQRKTEGEECVRQKGERLTEIENRFESRLAAIEEGCLGEPVA
jgi:hypothetical protein